ncbi:hypothetical protein [Allorhizobium ampelinum]|uniref:hypothetical protein n=1 Tax=Allorhizobium ampelinum TaxID=3025782 RepID=UPI000B400AFE|nr:hypothetical protein [Allorhizobium ampelinum]NTA27454.1 hypothetical protein [Allorhizobium ampelinum]OVE94510.1 hypothetical protein B7W85_13240 [Allorhizobium ampelinum]
MDIIDKFRHRLIRFLSCGDMIILNVERRTDGAFIPTNLGPALIANYNVRALDYGRVGLAIGFHYEWRIGLHIDFKEGEFVDCSILGGLGKGE